MPIRFSMTPRLLTLALGAFATLLAVVFVIGMRVGQAIQGATHAAPSAPGVRQAVDPRTLITPPTITPIASEITISSGGPPRDRRRAPRR